MLMYGFTTLTEQIAPYRVHYLFKDFPDFSAVLVPDQYDEAPDVLTRLLESAIDYSFAVFGTAPLPSPAPADVPAMYCAVLPATEARLLAHHQELNAGVEIAEAVMADRSGAEPGPEPGPEPSGVSVFETLDDVVEHARLVSRDQCWDAMREHLEQYHQLGQPNAGGMIRITTAGNQPVVVHGPHPPVDSCICGDCCDFRIVREAPHLAPAIRRLHQAAGQSGGQPEPEPELEPEAEAQP